MIVEQVAEGRVVLDAAQPSRAAPHGLPGALRDVRVVVPADMADAAAREGGQRADHDRGACPASRASRPPPGFVRMDFDETGAHRPMKSPSAPNHKKRWHI